ncbi:MAG: hypothetical protein ABIE36_02740 [Candidatus Diapherotrites archaeon]
MKSNTKRLFLSLFFSLLIVNLFGFFGIVSAAAGDTITYNVNQEINVDAGLGKVLGFLNITGTWREVVLGLIVLLIIFAALYDILMLINIFQIKWVKIIIAAGLAIVAALTNVVSKFTLFLLKVAAGFGAIGIFIEIIITIILFVGLAMGSNWIAKWAAKRKGQAAELAAIESSGDTKAAIRGMRNIQEEFERK